MKERIDRWRARWPAFDVVVAVAQKGGRDGVGRMSAVLSYYSFFSIFPLLLVFTSVLGSMMHGSWKTKLQESALANFPVIGEQISKQATHPLQGRNIATILGAVTALWAGSRAFDSFEQAMHIVWHGALQRQPGLLKRRLRAFMLLGVLGVGLIATTVLGGWAAAAPIGGLGRPLGFLVTIAANMTLLLVMYQVSIPDHQDWRRLLPGAVLGGVGLTILHAVGGWYIARVVAGASDTYGTFAVVLGLLTWVNLTGKLTIWPAELNAVLNERAELAAAIALPPADVLSVDGS